MRISAYRLRSARSEHDSIVLHRSSLLGVVTDLFEDVFTGEFRLGHGDDERHADHFVADRRAKLAFVFVLALVESQTLAAQDRIKRGICERRNELTRRSTTFDSTSCRTWVAEEDWAVLDSRRTARHNRVF